MSNGEAERERGESEITRAEFEQLKARVRALEYELEQTREDEDVHSSTAASATGLDRRDRTVLEHMQENGPLSGLALVKCYIRLTDIVDKKTAKRRAKNLETHPAYQEVTE